MSSNNLSVHKGKQLKSLKALQQKLIGSLVFIYSVTVG